MKQTENYQLNQWEKDDRIQMEDFNSDNAKIDAALEILGAEHTVIGTYTGDGTSGKRIINLGFTPKVVFISGWMSSKISLATLVFGTYSHQFDYSNSTIGGNIEITENGFAINGSYHNVSGLEERYFVIR